MVAKKLNNIHLWDLQNGTFYFDDKPIYNVSEADILEATKHDAIKTPAKKGDLRSLLGGAWDCAVVIREQLAFPASPYRAEVAKVASAFRESLGDELFEKFLRPTNRVGLPPKHG